MKVLTGRKRGNRSGGVQYVEGYRKPWRVRIMIDNRRLHLGNYKTQEEAEAVYKAAYASKVNESLGFLRDESARS